MTVAEEIDLNKCFTLEPCNGYTILNFTDPNNRFMIYDPGLYHTAICKSELCKIDKRDGKLYYRGVSVIDKLGMDFLDCAFEIIFGSSPRVEEFRAYVSKYLKLFDEMRPFLDAIPVNTHPMDALQMATIALGSIEGKYLDDPQDFVEKAAFLVAQTAVSVSYRYTKIMGTDWKEPGKDLPHSEKILHMMHGGKNPEKLKKLGKILNTIMILHAEHGQNCSSVAVRNVASSRGSIYTGIASGMAAFNGSIHGGASQHVSEMYEELTRTGEDPNAYVDRILENKQLLMGFGQRTYNRIQGCWDPRVETMLKILKGDSFDFSEVKSHREIAFTLIDRVNTDPFYVKKGLTPNPDLFNCIFYKLFGAPKEMNTTMLALGRITGWTANFVEHTLKKYPLTRPCDITVES